MKQLIYLLAAALALLTVANAIEPSFTDSKPKGLQQPIVFEANEGQLPDTVLFAARGARAAVWLESDGMTMRLKSPAEQAADNTLRLRWPGANPAATITGEGNLGARVNYLKGRDPGQWRTGIETFERVMYRGVWPGIDSVVYSRDGQVEYDFLVAPGADPGAIRLEFTDASGAPLHLTINEVGELVAVLPGGEFRQRAPIAFQESPAGELTLAARFVLRAPHIAGIEVDGADPALPLRIDPVVTYGTYLGGTAEDQGLAVAVDDKGYVYVAGNTVSSDFYTTQSLPGVGDPDGDIFITKFAPNGGPILWSTYFGGSLGDFVEDIAARPEGFFLCGSTESTDFPATAQAWQPDAAGNGDAFIAHISSDGQQIVTATYLGGAQNFDNATAIDVDGNLNVYVTGSTSSNDFPTSRPLPQLGTYQGGVSDVFVSVLRDGGRGLLFSTYLGGALGDNAYGIARDPEGLIYITGATISSADFPIVNAVQPNFGGGGNDAFFSVINPNQPQLIASSFLGGSSNEAGLDLKLMPGGRAVIVGETSSTLFPAQRPLPGVAGFNSDLFITVLEPGGGALYFSTRIGGNLTDRAESVAVDSQGFIYATGWTFSDDFPTTSAYQPTPGGINAGLSESDAFVVKVDPVAPRLVYATYLGGNRRDLGYDIAASSSGPVWVTGETNSTDFPVFSAWQPELNNEAATDAFVARLTELPASPVFDAPRVVRSIYFDIGDDGFVEQGDPLTLMFDRPVVINPHLLNRHSVFLPVENDTIGGTIVEGAGLPVEPTFEVNPLNRRQLLMHCGISPVLEPAGDFSPGQIGSGSASGIDIAANLPPTAITSIYGVPAIKNPDVLAVDVRWNFRLEGYFIDQPTSDTLELLPNTISSAYSRHRLIFPPNSIAETQVLLRPAGGDPRVTNAMEINVTGQVEFDPPATLRLQYLPVEVDTDSGQVERGMRIHQLVVLPNNETAWVPVPGEQRVDLVNKWVEVEISSLNPTEFAAARRSGDTVLAGAAAVGIFGNIAGETIESRSFIIKPSSSEVVTFLNTSVLTPGARGFYTQHAIEFPGYVETTPDDPAGIRVTMRKPGLFDLIPADGGQEWPLESAALMIIETADALGSPVTFSDPVNITVQFYDGTVGTFNDVWDFANQPGNPQGMLLAGDAAAGFGIDGQFTGGVSNEVSLAPGGGTTSANGVVNLTDSEGIGLWGVVAGEPVVTIRHGWMLK